MGAKQEAQDWADDWCAATASATKSPTSRSAGSTRKTARWRSASAASTGSPGSWSKASGGPPATPTNARSAASSTRRCCRPRSSPRPTCPTWRRSSPPSTSSRSRGPRHVQQRFSRKVEFESLDFNKRFWTTVPKEFDPVALRELFGPGFLAWVTTMTGEIELRRQRPPALVHLAAARAQRGRTESGAEKRRPAVPAAAVGDGRERHPHLPARPLARRAGAVPGRARGRRLAARPELAARRCGLVELAQLAEPDRVGDAGEDEAGARRPRRPAPASIGSVERPR